MTKSRQNLEWTVLGAIHIYYRFSHEGTSLSLWCGTVRIQAASHSIIGLRCHKMEFRVGRVAETEEENLWKDETTEGGACKSPYKLSSCLGWLVNCEHRGEATRTWRKGTTRKLKELTNISDEGETKFEVVSLTKLEGFGKCLRL